MDIYTQIREYYAKKPIDELCNDLFKIKQMITTRIEKNKGYELFHLRMHYQIISEEIRKRDIDERRNYYIGIELLCDLCDNEEVKKIFQSYLETLAAFVEFS